MVEIGIHTFGLFHSCSYSDVQNIIEMLQDNGHCRKIKSDAENINRTYFSDYFSNQGVLVYMYQRVTGKSGIMLRVTPCTMLGGRYAATELYCPTKESYRKLCDSIDEILKDLKLGFTIDDMSICRVDPCANISFEDRQMVPEYLRIVKKLVRVEHYRMVQYAKDSKAVKDAPKANAHSYRISSKRASFTVYDKKFVLQQLERCPDDLLDKGLLRVEAELQREALLKRIHAERGWSNGKILKKTADAAEAILLKYLRQMLGGTGRHLRYRDAVQLIENAGLKTKMRERMCYLLRKSSDSQTLTAAIEKLKVKYSLKSNQCKTILTKFEELDVSPITLRNDSDYESLPSLLSFFEIK